MKTKILASISGLLVSLLTPLAILVPQASAAVVTWDGEGADNNFSTATNWSGDTVPVNGDSLTFDMSVLTQSETLNNDLVGLDIAGLNLTGTPSSFYSITLQGNDLTISGDITGNQTDGQVYLDLDVVLGANITYSVIRSGVSFGDNSSPTVRNLDLGTYNITYATPSTSCYHLFVASSLSGSGNITSNTGSAAIVFMKGANGYSGDVTSNGDGIGVFADSLYGFSNITINGSGKLGFKTGAEANTLFDVNIVMNSTANPSLGAYQNTPFACSGAMAGAAKKAIIDGSLTLLSDTIYYGENNMQVNGTFTDNGNTLSVGAGSAGSITTSSGVLETPVTTTTINASDKSTVSFTISNKETVVLNGERGQVYVNNGGVLKGTGKADGIVINTGGTLAPGLSPGCITSSSGLTITGTYQVEIAGATACTEYDQTVVTGTVDVTGGTLQVLPFLNSYKPADNTAFMIISNDAADAVVGTFAGLADGATFAVAGYTMQINYNGGDGNDVMLLVTEVPAAPDTGIGSALTSPLMALGATLAAFAVVGGLKFADRRQR